MPQTTLKYAKPTKPVVNYSDNSTVLMNNLSSLVDRHRIVADPVPVNIV
jgi:hypothetical protein